MTSAGTVDPDEGLKLLERARELHAAEAEEGSQLEAVQHLADLGYLPFEAPTRLAQGQALGQELELAIGRLRLELVASGGGLAFEGQPGSLLPEEVIELRELVDFERNHRPLPNPTLGQTSLRSRIVHYRLRQYDIDAPGIAEPYSERTVLALERLGQRLGIEDAPSVLSVLDDSGAVAERVVSMLGTRPLLVHAGRHLSEPSTRVGPLSRMRSARGSGATGDRGPARPRRPYGSLVVTTDGLADAQIRLTQLRVPRLRQQWVRLQQELEARSTPAADGMSSVQRLAVRVLQLRLWVLGYYDGRLDTIVGARTMEAVDRAVRDEHHRSPPSRSALALPVDVGDGWVAMSGRLLLFGLQAYDLGRLESADLERYAAEAAAREEPEQERSWWQRLWRGAVDLAKHAYSVARRVYYGFRRVVSSIGNAIGKGVRWLLQVMDQGSQWASQLIQRAIGFAREGIRKLAEGLEALGRWVLGQPIRTRSGSEGGSITLFQRDFDSASYVPKSASPLEIEAHVAEVERYGRSFAWALGGLGTAVSIAIAALSSGAPWHVLLIRLGRLVVG